MDKNSHESPERCPVFSGDDSLADLDALIALARVAGATRLLILPGKPVVYRVGGQLSEPVMAGRVHFSQTERLIAALLSDEQKADLDVNGDLDMNYPPSDGGEPVQIQVFYGDGAHNLVIFLG